MLTECMQHDSARCPDRLHIVMQVKDAAAAMRLVGRDDALCGGAPACFIRSDKDRKNLLPVNTDDIAAAQTGLYDREGLFDRTGFGRRFQTRAEVENDKL